MAERDILPNFTKLIKITWTVPLSSCSAERSFSCLRRVKTCVRSMMGQERLSSLALLQIERDIRMDNEQVMDRFVRETPHKLSF